MNFLGALVCVVLFAVCLQRTRIIANTQNVLTCARNAVGIMRDTELDDEIKEKTIQNSSLELFRLLAKLAAGAAVSLGIPLLVIWLLSRPGWMQWEQVLAILLNPLFVAVTLVAAFVGYRLIPR